VSDFIETILAVGTLESDRHQERQAKARVEQARLLRSLAESSDREAASDMATKRLTALTSDK
jgi:hypothetical protein